MVVCNFADDTIFHAGDNDLNTGQEINHETFLAIEWFETNNMKLNKNKCHENV